MNDDERCCGTGICLINAEGLCWCGQQWNGSTMCRPAESSSVAPEQPTPKEDAAEGSAP